MTKITNWFVSKQTTEVSSEILHAPVDTAGHGNVTINGSSTPSSAELAKPLSRSLSASPGKIQSSIAIAGISDGRSLLFNSSSTTTAAAAAGAKAARKPLLSKRSFASDSTDDFDDFDDDDDDDDEIPVGKSRTHKPVVKAAKLSTAQNKNPLLQALLSSKHHASKKNPRLSHTPDQDVDDFMKELQRTSGTFKQAERAFMQADLAAVHQQASSLSSDAVTGTHDDLYDKVLGDVHAETVKRLVTQNEQLHAVSVFYYFQLDLLSNDSPHDQTELPPLDHGWIKNLLVEDEHVRKTMFTSGFVRDSVLLAHNRLPLSIIKWLFLELAREPDEFLALAYAQVLLATEDSRKIDIEVINQMFINLGIPAKYVVDQKAVIELTDPSMMPVVAATTSANPNLPRYRLANIKLVIEVFEFIFSASSSSSVLLFTRALFRPVVTFAIRALLDHDLGPQVLSNAHALLATLIDQVPESNWQVEQAHLMRSCFFSVTDPHLRLCLLRMLPVVPGGRVMKFRTTLALAFFVDDVNRVLDLPAEATRDRIPIGRLIIPELTTNPIYRLSTAGPKQANDGSNGAATELVPSSSSSQSTVDDDDDELQQYGDVTMATEPTNHDEDETEPTLITSSWLQANAIDYKLLRTNVCLLDYSLMTMLKVDKDYDKIKTVTELLGRLFNRIFDPQARFPDRTDAKDALQSVEFRLMYAILAQRVWHQSFHA
ncbi:hypothetical protein V1514DRAFT_19824 [Lipomyces japonicus]|uniref:uncharacterized protein n=1 Tax=Lipomyces japonicus TaxID=56871 RepID=UPI0034CD120A